MKEGYIIERTEIISKMIYFWKAGFWLLDAEEAELFEHKKDAKFVVRKLRIRGIYKIEKVFIVQ